VELLLLALFLSIPSLAAAQMPVSVDEQASLFKKIFGYSRSLSTEESPTIAIVFGEEQETSAGELRIALAGVNLVSTLVGPESPVEVLDESDVVYMMDEAGVRKLKRRCEARGLLTITGWPELVENGRASIGLAKKANGRPEIVVNVQSLKAEDQMFSSDLLKLARLVQ
jgi:hypothetical protein